jgi:zona occludens toxin
MSIKIHHGFPGSYKTSGAVQDDFIPAALAGRHIVTNVRGLDNEDRIREVLEGQGMTVPDTFRLTHFDTSDSVGMDSIRKFFHWCPNGAFLLLDEIQEIYPRSFRDSQVNQLNFAGGLDAATAAGKPSTLALAFEKHRHFNWDMVVTTPHIAKVHPLVRGCSEGGYKHKNLAVLGNLFKGKYVEGFHPADTNGKTSDFYNVSTKRIKPYVFKLYQSTATGVATDTTAGQSIFKNGKVLGLLLGLIVIFVALAFMPTSKVVKATSAKAPEGSVATDPVVAPVNPAVAGGVNPVAVNYGGVRVADSFPVRLRFLEWDSEIVSSGQAFGHSLWVIRFTSAKKERVDLRADLAFALGLDVRFESNCWAMIKGKGIPVTSHACTVVPDQSDEPQIADNAIGAGLAGAGSLVAVPPVEQSPPIN